MGDPGNGAEPPVALVAVQAGYGTTPVIRNTTLTLAPGMTLLAAANGAGKTTLLRLCAGILRPTSGRIRVLGKDPYRDAQVRARIGYLSHQAGLDPGLTVTENLEFWARLRGYTGQRRAQEVGRVLTELELGPQASAPASALSRGQRQRAALARALLGNPALLLLDEPATGLDPGWYDRVTRLLEHRISTERTCVLLASHDPRDHATGVPVLDIHEGVVRRTQRHGAASEPVCYRVRVHSAVRVTESGPWTVRYDPDDPRVMWVSVSAQTDLAAFIAMLARIPAPVVALRLASPEDGSAASVPVGADSRPDRYPMDAERTS